VAQQKIPVGSRTVFACYRNGVRLGADSPDQHRGAQGCEDRDAVLAPEFEIVRAALN
jgi:hypothetical protein